MKRIVLLLTLAVVMTAMMSVMAAPVFAQSFAAPEGGDSVELLLSGGPAPTDQILVDDDLYVYLNGSPILVNNDDWATYLDPVSFTAKDGNQLRIVAENDIGPCWLLSSLYLHSTSDGTSYRLTEGVAHNCSAPLGLFYDETFTITVDSGNNDPTSKLECKKGGYKEFGFKNQGQCIKTVNHGSK